MNGKPDWSDLMIRKTLTFLSASVFAVGLLLSSADCTTAGKSEEAAKETAKVEEKVEIEWMSYDEGMAKAKKEDKHVLIDFYTTWCGWCKKMDKTTFQDAAVVKAVSDNMIAIKINAESNSPVVHEAQKITERELSGKIFGVRGFPTYWFVDPKGQRLFPVPGYRSATDFLDLVEYVGESHYKKASFAAFIEAKKNGGKPTN
jgi:thioredoxin-related protein